MRRFTRVVCFDLNLRGPYKDGKTLVKRPEGLRTCLPSSIFLIFRTSTGDLSSVLAPMLLHRLHLLYDGSRAPPHCKNKHNHQPDPLLLAGRPRPACEGPFRDPSGCSPAWWGPTHAQRCTR